MLRIIHFSYAILNFNYSESIVPNFDNVRSKISEKLTEYYKKKFSKP